MSTGPVVQVNLMSTLRVRALAQNCVRTHCINSDDNFAFKFFFCIFLLIIHQCIMPLDRCSVLRLDMHLDIQKLLNNFI